MITEAIKELAPNAEWVLTDDDLSTLNWLSSDITRPTDAEINAKVAELESGEPLRLLRLERNRLISETDWWASSDLTMTAEQTTYRQALRDITETYTSLDDVVWPTKPEN
jgi:hypothetical protein